MRVDLHTHTTIVSDCSLIQPEEMVAAAIAARMDAVCVTDHVFHGEVLCRDPSHPFDGYRAVHRRADGTGLVVLPGIEFTFDQGDFLVYGLYEEILPELGADYALETCLALAQREGGIVVQAHPFRYGGRPVFGTDAIETCNGGNSEEHNQMAQAWSQKHGVLGLAGSDAHQSHEIGRCHTVLEMQGATLSDLCMAIREGRVKHLEHWHAR